MQEVEEARNNPSNHNPKCPFPSQTPTSSKYPMHWPQPSDKTKAMDLADQEEEDPVDQEDPHKYHLPTSSLLHTCRMSEP